MCEKNTEKFSKADVLRVLVEHGASVMVNAKDGLPVAYHIVVDPSRRLTPALSSLFNTSRFNPLLLERLNGFLDAHPNLDPKKRLGLLRVIEQYDVLKGFNNPLGQARGVNERYSEIGEKSASPLYQRLVDASSEDIVEKLKGDSEFRQKHLELLRLIKAYVKKLSPLERRKHAKMGADTLENLNEFLKSNLTKCDFNTLKKLTLDTLSDAYISVEAQIELIDVNKRLRQGHTSHKSMRNDERRAAQLAALVNEKSAAFRMLDPKNKYGSLYMDLKQMASDFSPFLTPEMQASPEYQASYALGKSLSETMMSSRASREERNQAHAALTSMMGLFSPGQLTIEFVDEEDKTEEKEKKESQSPTPRPSE